MRVSKFRKTFYWGLVLFFVIFTGFTPAHAMVGAGQQNPSDEKTRIEINPYIPDKDELQDGDHSSSSTDIYSPPDVLIACPSTFERQVVFYVNQERGHAGLAPLVMDVRLHKAARQMSADMAAWGFVPADHIDSKGRSFDIRVAEEGAYPYIHLGEVIAGGFPTPQEVVKAWMNSPGHRARLMDERYEHIGVGYTYNTSAAHWFYWTADLGTTTENLQLPALDCELGFYNLFLAIMRQ